MIIRENFLEVSTGDDASHLRGFGNIPPGIPRRKFLFLSARWCNFSCFMENYFINQILGERWLFFLYVNLFQKRKSTATHWSVRHCFLFKKFICSFWNASVIFGRCLATALREARNSKYQINIFGRVRLNAPNVSPWSGWNPQGFRRRGRPKQSWKRSVQDELAKKNIIWIETKKTPTNRVRCRPMVDSLM